MFIDTTTSRRGKKVYVRHMLRTSYREDGKVKHKTLLNLSNCSDDEITALKLAFKHKGKLTSIASLDDIEVTLGKSIGAVWSMNCLAGTTGVSKALGASPEGKLALLQVISRVIDQGSRLSAVRFAQRQAICEILGIKKLTEQDLYENLAWLAEKQEKIEKNLFTVRFGEQAPTLFLYDVTSSYLEGEQNELGTWGYNRDKKKGKRQIVVGLLTGPDGLPVAVRVFKGNTVDTHTVADQVRILAKSFGVKNITLVGDRGMLKGPQITALPEDFRYVTAISKPQIRKMLGQGTLQLELFSDHVCEVASEGVRYILRRNPVRREQIAGNRASKLTAIQNLAEERTSYLAGHSRASVEKAVEKVTAKITKLAMGAWVSAVAEGRVISIHIDSAAREQSALLDGCYVIKSDVPKEDADTQALHDRYCDLEMVERAFRTMKTSHLELRPIFVQKEASTKGHVFVVMLALILQRELEKATSGLDVTVEEAIEELAAIRMQEIQLGNASVQNIPKPTKLAALILKNANIVLPTALPNKTANVYCKKKLTSERKQPKL